MKEDKDDLKLLKVKTEAKKHSYRSFTQFNTLTISLFGCLSEFILLFTSKHILLSLSEYISLFLLTEGEADWKMIAIAITDPWAAILNDVDDLESKLPGMLRIKYQNCTVLYTVLTYLVLCYTVL